MRRIAVITVLALAGCTGNEGDVDFSEHARGDRLAPMLFYGEDGSRAVLGMRDTLLDATCDFQRVVAREVCLPAGQWISLTMYSDATCTTPLTDTDTSGPFLDTRHLGVWKSTGMLAEGACFFWNGEACTTGPCGKLYTVKDASEDYVFGDVFNAGTP